ncbi:hypothetical protein PIB30_048028 [Stylosanthes scabra]|uniref:Myb-like DNA-binding domain containing protein n=1 Tax=Stylosanthes scabra TaxID=79078 RepID=A0ABU6ZFM3_9FABA|nr:hypothetical protein [Stylosanthes scabra]
MNPSSKSQLPFTMLSSETLAPTPPPSKSKNPSQKPNYNTNMNVPNYFASAFSTPATMNNANSSWLPSGNEQYDIIDFINQNGDRVIVTSAIASANNSNNQVQIWDFANKIVITPKTYSSVAEVEVEVATKNDTKANANVHSLIKGHQWTPDEDMTLEALVNENENKQKKWSEIAKSLDGRNPKQCRERWHNHLQPNIKKGKWTPQEDMILMKAHMEIGANKWAKISKRLAGRTDNSIKNRWNCIKRRRTTVNSNLNKPNNNNDFDGSKMLRAYINEVAAAQAEVASSSKSKSKSKNDSNKNKGKAKMFNGFKIDLNNPPLEFPSEEDILIHGSGAGGEYGN